MTHPTLSASSVKNAQFSGWVRQLRKNLGQFKGKVEQVDDRPSMEQQILFVQQQYELLSVLHEALLGWNNPDGIKHLVGVDVDQIAEEANRSRQLTKTPDEA